MRWFEQLTLRLFDSTPKRADNFDLQETAKRLLREAGAHALGNSVRVIWNSRMRSAAGRAEYQRNLVSLNPRLREHGADEIDRTLRHELAHLLAHARAGRRRISPHGNEWRQACADLGIAGEARCHQLPFPISIRARRYLYQCPRCRQKFPRARRVRRPLACLECCRKFNRGQFDPAAKLRLIARPNEPP